MWSHIMKKPLVLAGALAMVVALVAAACGGDEETTPTPEAIAGTGHLLAAHAPGAPHELQPKRLENVVEVDMYEFHFANPQGEKNPTFRLPAGKTVGIHIHNEGSIVHEFAIGRGVQTHGGEPEYDEFLTELVPSDLFFYDGDVKAEVEDATFGEIEVEPGIRDLWIRLNIPEEFKGEWEVGCFVEGHYELGMHAKIIVG